MNDNNNNDLIILTDEYLEVIDTTVTADELKNGVRDEYGCLYSKNGKRLLEMQSITPAEYRVKNETEVICDEAFCWCDTLEKIILPPKLKAGCVYQASV